jgi:precorrin-4/cobalt-precorrin-4 C11-methyltransferase
VPAALLDHCRPDAELHDSKAMTLEEITAVYAAHPDAAIARLHSGDPTVFGAIAEQIDWCLAHERSFEIVPGVSSLQAAAAAAGRELTVPAVSQTVVLTRVADRTSASMRPGEGVAAVAVHGATLAVFLSAARPDALRDELLAAGSGYSARTPAVIASRVSWPDEQIVDTTVGELVDELRRLGTSRTVLVLVGDALGHRPAARRSHVYSPEYEHTFRDARPPS